MSRSITSEKTYSARVAGYSVKRRISSIFREDADLVVEAQGGIYMDLNPRTQAIVSNSRSFQNMMPTALRHIWFLPILNRHPVNCG